MLATEQLPASFNLVLRGRAGTARAVAEVHHYRWLEPQRQTYLDGRHCIDMVLSRRPPAARGRFVEEGACDPHAIGKVIFLPGGHTLESEWAAGEQQSVCCTIDGTLVEDEALPGPLALAGALDIHNPFVSASLARLAQEALAPGFASGLVVESLCQAVLVDLQRTWHRHEQPPHRLSRMDVTRVNEMLDVEGPGPGISELAAAFGLSSRHFTRLFRAATGCSVGEHAAAFRMARAKVLLSRATPMIKEVAWRCGFENAAAFSAAFRRNTGQTPRAWRVNASR